MGKQKVTSIKPNFLWVIIDNKINLKDCITCIAGKVSYGIGMMIKALQCLQNEALLTLNNAFVLLYFTHFNHIRGPLMFQTWVNQSGYRMLFCRLCAMPKIGSGTYYAGLAIFGLTDISKYLIGRSMFRFCNIQVHALFHTFFAYNHEIHSYDTRLTHSSGKDEF